MDWENERYVRLFTRDTLTWRLLGWQGQAVLALLSRKLDRAGVLDTDGEPPALVVAAVTGIPEEISRIGLAALVDRGVVEVGDRVLVMPNFIEAQEANASDAQRQRESRARRRDRARRTVTKRDETVTECDALTDVTKRDGRVADCGQPVTKRDRTVTPTRDETVTPSLAVPSLPDHGDDGSSGERSGSCGKLVRNLQESSSPTPSPQSHIPNALEGAVVSPSVPDSPWATSPPQGSQEPPQAVGSPGGSSAPDRSENGTRAGSGALRPLGGLRAELDARRKELADRAAALPIDDGARPRPASPEDKLGAVAQGLRHELDAMRRQVMADTGAHLGPLSRKGSETLDGIAAALEDHEPAEILEIARWRAEQVAAGTSAQVLWVCLFHGNGFSLTVRERLEAKDGGKRWRPWADIESELRDNAKRYGWEASKLEHELDDAREFYERRESL